MRSSRPSRGWALVGAFAALLAVGLIAPGTATAGCEHPGERPRFDLNLDPDPGPGAAAPVPAPKPCTGPSCSNRSAPAPTSAARPLLRLEQWGLAAEAPPIPDARPIAWAVEDAAARPIRLAPSIFHPPRSPR